MKLLVTDFKSSLGIFLSLVQSGRSKRVKVDGPQSGRSLAKLDGHLIESGRPRTIVDGLLSQSGRSWVKVDGNSTKSGRFFG